MNQDLVSYYNDRANEYEKVYHNPAEQADLQQASAIFQNIFSNRHVLEVACGTGYWTEQISKTAKSIFATDINQSVVDIAKGRPLHNTVTFRVADMYNLTIDQKFDGLFGGFIWSHILVQDLDRFLHHIKQFLTPGAPIAFIDSNPVAGTHHDQKRIAQTDEHGNTYQARKLDNGTPHLVLKNFPTPEFFSHALSPIATDIHYTRLEHYWIVNGKAR
jgi:ubiquinone/menaquinone biosynthesis C-methylase UbiE